MDDLISFRQLSKKATADFEDVSHCHSQIRMFDTRAV